MPNHKAIWDSFDGSAAFLEQGFLEQGWTYDRALQEFSARFGPAGSRSALAKWWSARSAAMSRDELLQRVIASASASSAAIESKLAASGEPALRAIAALCGDIVLNLGVKIRLALAGGPAANADEITHSLKLVDVLAEKALRAAEAAGKQQDRDLNLRKYEQQLADAKAAQERIKAECDAAKAGVIDQTTIERIERELKLL